ncbi:MAG TPA: serine hydrolase domain-containing protein [Chitinophagaceae bacterium]|nr:serine hydrolase domain-containing protein [Chitinophagaceae bacterium]
MRTNFHIKTGLVLAGCILLAPWSAFLQPPYRAKLDSLFDKIDQHKMGMGSMVISKNGHLLYQRSVGHCIFSGLKKQAAGSDTKYRIGSISKIFTAVLIFQLIEEGRLELSTKLDAFFPSLPNASNVNIEQLLRHKSGFTNITEVPHKQKPRSPAQMLTIISRNKTLGPGTKTEYSNANYLILGYIIENIYNQPYADVLQQRLVKKIGLKDTYFGDKVEPAKGECYSYKPRSRWRRQTPIDLSIVGGSGGIVSTPADLARFIESLFSHHLISTESLSQMITITEEQGMGLRRYSFYGKDVYGHPGGIDAFESVVAYFPGDSVAIAYCSNGQVYPVENIALGALCIFFNKAYSIPSFKKSHLSKKLLDKYCGEYLAGQPNFKIQITRFRHDLFANIDGFPSYPLMPGGKHRFVFEPAAISLEFQPRNRTLKLVFNNNGMDLVRSK